MRSGSSALINESSKQINSPKLRVSLLENLNVTGTSSFVRMPALVDAIIFNNNLVCLGSTPDELGGLKTRVIQTYSLDGATQRLSLGTSIAHFYNAGNTLIAYSLSAGSTMQRTFSTDGVTFTNPETINIIGASINGVSYNMIDIQATNVSTFYITRLLEQQETDALDVQFWGTKRSIYSVRNIGSTWGATLIYNMDAWQFDSLGSFEGELIENFAHGILAANIGPNLDRILIKGRRGASIKGEGMRVVDTDGLNIFGEREIVNTNPLYPRAFRLTNYVKSNNDYYFIASLEEQREGTAAEGIGICFLTTYSLGNFLFRSSNFRDWTIPVYLGPSLHDKFPLVSGGSLGNLFTSFGSSRGDLKSKLEFFMGTSTLDLSDNVISYSNQNNDRISLTLGNMK